ncbi:hypothetical protein Bca4012_061015 [Brassica carinata]
MLNVELFFGGENSSGRLFTVGEWYLTLGHSGDREFGWRCTPDSGCEEGEGSKREYEKRRVLMRISG